MAIASMAASWLPERFEYQRTLGSGGMSDVWLVYDRTHKRLVVVKALSNWLLEDSNYVIRFRREITWAQQLGGQFLPRVFEILDLPDHIGFVMEYMGEQNLKQVLDGQPCDIQAGIGWMRDMMSCVKEVHVNSLVHRDIKPQNFVLCRNKLRLTDLGIARRLDTVSGLTDDGQVLATASYTSPEQALGHQVCPSSDLYSLGVVMWEMFAGCELFTGDSQVAVAMKHVQETPPDLKKVNPDVPDWIADLIHWCLEKEVSARPGSVSALLSTIETEAVKRPPATVKPMSISVMLSGKSVQEWSVTRNRKLANVVIWLLRQLTA